LNQLAVHHDMRAGRAEVGRAARSLAESAEKLHFNRNREILVLGHRFGRLTVQHHATVAGRPAFATGTLLADKAILDADSIMRELVLVENVAEAAVEIVVLVVRDSHHPIFDAKSVAEVFAQLVSFDFGRPAGQVLAVEETDTA